MPPLPYDATPPPSPPHDAPPEPIALDAIEELGPLDRPLDDYQPVVPDHVQSLMGRMSKGKVYLLEDTPAVIHVDVDSRVRGDPRIAALAEQLDEHDPTEWLNVVSAAAPSPIRHNALYIRSDLIKHLSTSKIFSWVTSLGTAVMGIEWLNDTTLHLIFPSPSASLLALTLLSKAGFDPAEGDDPLLERSAHSIPISLLAKADFSSVESKVGEELLAEAPEERDGVQRKGRGGFRSGIMADTIVVGAPVPTNWVLEDGIDPHARVTVRFGIEADQKLRSRAPNSEWYARNGKRAGKEVAAHKRVTPYDRPDRFGNAVASSARWGHDDQEGQSLARRIGRGRGAKGNRGNGRSVDTADDLDRELEGLRGGYEPDSKPRGGSGRDDRGERRPKREKEDLDRELDDMFGTA